MSYTKYITAFICLSLWACSHKSAKTENSPTIAPDKTVDGANASAIVDSLTSGGIALTTDATGAKQLKVAFLRCVVVVTLGLPINCSTADSSTGSSTTLQMSDDAASKLHTALLAAGAGQQRPSNIAGSSDWCVAENLVCLRQSSGDQCSFNLSSPQ